MQNEWVLQCTIEFFNVPLQVAQQKKIKQGRSTSLHISDGFSGMV